MLTYNDSTEYNEHYILKVWIDPSKPKYFECWGWANAMKSAIGWTECGYIVDIFRGIDT